MRKFRTWILRFTQGFKRKIIGIYFAAPLLLLIFAIAVNMVISQNSQEALREECAKTNKAQSFQFCLMMDELVGNADAAMQLMEKSAVFYDSIFPISQGNEGADVTIEEVLDIRNLLQIQNKQNQHDLFLFFKNSGIIISAKHNTAISSLYYRLNYQSDLLPYDAWLEKLGDVNGKSLILLYSGKYPHLACVRALPLTQFRTAPLVCVTVFSERVLQSQIRNNMQPESLLCMYGQDGQLLFSTDRELAEALPLEALEHNASYTIGESGNQYHVSVLSSEETDCFYVSAMREEVYLKPFLQAQRFQTVMNIFLFVIGLILVFILARRLSRPVKETVRLVQADSPVTEEAKNDFEYLQQAFRHSQSQRNELISKMNEHRTVLQQYFLYEAMMGRVADRHTLKAQFEKHQIPCVSDFFSTVTVGLPEDAADASSVKKLLPEFLEREHIKCYSIVGMEPLVVFLLNYIPDTTSDRIYKLLGQFQRQHPCTLCCSDCFQGMDGIHQSFHQAQKLNEYAVIFGETKVITSGALVRSTDFSLNESFQASAKTAIRGFIRSDDKDAGALFDSLRYQYLNGSEFSPFAARCFIIDLSFILYQSFAKYCTEDAAQAAALILRFDTLPSLVRFRELFSHAMGLARQDYREAHTKETVAHRVNAYLEANYQDATLGVGTLNHLFGMSSHALSEAYRQETGQSIGDALTKIRVRHACELLQNKDLSLDTIAQSVGILGSSSLIRLFKKVKGITPGGYRKELLTGEETGGIA